MDEVMKLDQQIQALTYAIDMLDMAWSINPEEFEGKLLEQKEIEMKAHRRTLCEMKDEILEKFYTLKYGPKL